MNESITLKFTEGSSDKVYKAELKESGEGWVVNFAYGRTGSSLATGTKTKIPIVYELAKKTYNKLVDSKAAKGYKEEGASSSINVVNRQDAGVRPQLLNEIEEDDVEKYIRDPNYCMQEKFDGRRKMVIVGSEVITGVNKKGFVVALTDELINDCDLLKDVHILDGEDLGDMFMVFDDVQRPELMYVTRHTKLTKAVKDLKHVHVVKTAWTLDDKLAMLSELLSSNAEGVVFKKIDAEVKPGRPNSGGDQFKFKFYSTASCIVGSISNVKRSIGIQVIDEFGNTLDVGNVTVYPNQDIPKIGDIVEIKYLYYYPNGSIYQPVLLSIRDDVNKQECLRSKLKEKRVTIQL